MSSTNKQYSLIRSKCGNGFLQEFEDCYQQLTKLASGNTLLYFSVFIKAQNNLTFYADYDRISEMIDASSIIKSPYSIIAQTPDDSVVAIEACYLLDKVPVNYHENYCTKSYPTHDEIYAFGIRGKRSDSIKKSTDSVFQQMEDIVAKEQLTFAAIVRQWNYVENILGRTENETIQTQNYQQLNNTRSYYYDKSHFINGYPAATGIGTSAGGINVDFIAVRPNKELTIIPVRNKKQENAYAYSHDVLIGGTYQVLSPPMFERAKLLQNGSGGELFISGTASILGEKTEHIDSVCDQTRFTLQMIDELIVQVKKVFNHCKILRVYVKNKEDISLVKNVLEKTYPKTKNLFLIGDICREELLVEIEGIFN